MPDFAVRIVEISRDETRPEVKAKTLAPLTFVAALGCFLSIVLLVLSIKLNDGMGLLADILLSFLSTIVGIGNKWKLQLPKRRVKNNNIPPGDVVIRYPKGSFLIVKCAEDVARELYFAPENINYWVSHPPLYRVVALVGTMMLMGGVICLGNAGNGVQVAFAASYMILNAAYWIVAALPAKLHWDTSTFVVRHHRFSDTEDSPKFISYNNTFTKALWRAIVATKSSEWIRRGQAAPQTEVWDRWLKDAERKSKEVGYHVEPLTMKKDEGIIVWDVPLDFDPQQHFHDLTAEVSEVSKPSTKFLLMIVNLRASPIPHQKSSLPKQSPIRKRSLVNQ
jgi:hypothetical protein